MKEQVLAIIKQIRASKPDWEEYYLRGHCYELFIILNSIYPKSMAYETPDHVVTKIGNHYYDITGEITDLSPNGSKYFPMTCRSHKDYFLNQLFSILDLS